LTTTQVASVISIDQYERWLAGERVRAEVYIAELPAGPEFEQAACDIIYGEFLLREQLGEKPTLDEYRQRFPTVADALSRQVEVHLALGEMKSESSHLSSGMTIGNRTRPSRPTDSGTPKIAGYELFEEIGRGGMGVVYRARQLSVDRIVAVKVMQIPSGADTGLLDRMNREAIIAAKVSHPHIVIVHDAKLDLPWFYIVMEYVPGIDLHRMVEKEGPLLSTRASEYMRQAALGLQHAYEQGLVHRDIKPSNLIVARNDERSSRIILKILDLGLARLQAAQSEDSNQQPLTQLGAFMGTPDFIAPEQANDPRLVDIRSDLYSLGCSFYYLLTGKLPFSGATALAKIMQHHMAEPPSVNAERRDIPAGVVEIVRKLMAKNPSDRFQTPDDLANALVPFAGAPPSSGLIPVVRLPRATTYRLTQRLGGNTDRIRDLAFSPDSRHLLCAGQDKKIRIWAMTKDPPELIRELPITAGPSCLAFSPDGKHFVVGAEDRALRLFDFPSCRLLWEVADHRDLVGCVAFAPQGDKILSASHDGTLRWCRASNGEATRTWQAHNGTIWGIAITPDGKRILSGGQDRSLRYWDAATNESLTAFPDQGALVTTVAISPDARRALTGGVDGVLHLWDMEKLTEIRTFTGHDGRITDVCFSPDGRTAVSSSRDKSVRIWDINNGRQTQSINEHSNWVTIVTFASDGKRIASGGIDRTVFVYEPQED
jgi:serine/threonine protein kinase